MSQQFEWINPESIAIRYGERDCLHFHESSHDDFQSFHSCPESFETVELKTLKLSRHVMQQHFEMDRIIRASDNAFKLSLLKFLCVLVSSVRSRQIKNFIHKVVIAKHLNIYAIVIRVYAYTERVQDFEFAMAQAQIAMLETLNTGRADNISISLTQTEEQSINSIIFGNIHQTQCSGSAIYDNFQYYLSPELKKSEDRALKLLAGMISKEDFEKYRQYGTITIQGKSGKYYKVHKHFMIKVYDRKNKPLYSLCIESASQVPPTDQVISRIKLIKSDEKKLHKIAKRFGG